MTNNVVFTPEHWNGETRRLAEQIQTSKIPAVAQAEAQGFLAVASELADLRKALEPEVTTASLKDETLVEQRARDEEEDTVNLAVQERRATLQMVGWYCAGGHPDENNSEMVKPNLRFSDPCQHGVPVFVAVTP